MVIQAVDFPLTITMPPRRVLSVVDRGRAIGMYQQGLSVRLIANRTGVSPSVIQRLKERWQNTGRVEDRPRSGRPRKTTRQQDRHVVLSCLRDRSATAEALRASLRNVSNVNVSTETVRRRLHAAGLKARRAAVRVPLSRNHRTRRLAFARFHRRWTRNQWSKVLFTDESRFTLRFNDGRIRVWRRPGERFVDATIREHDRYGGGSVMVWGGFSLHHRTPLHIVNGRLTGVAYRDTILRPLVLPALQAVGNGAIFQDDNAPCHRAAVVNAFLQQQGVNRMDWPARSPDLNPIEHLWDVLGRRVRALNPPAVTLQELSQQLQQEWLAIPQHTLRRLVDSMRRRCDACVNEHGGHTRY